MAIETTHLEFTELETLFNAKPQFKILCQRGKWVGLIHYHAQYREYRTELFGMRAWSYHQFAEISEFVKELQNRLDAI